MPEPRGDVKSTLAAAYWFGWFFAVPALVVFALCTARVWPACAASVGTAVFIGALVPATAPQLRWPGTARALTKWSVRSAMAYFGCEVVLDDVDATRLELSRGKRLLFAMEPHDTLPIGVMAFNRCARAFADALPRGEELTVFALVSDAIFLLPFMKQIFHANEARPATRNAIETAFKQGHSVVICPGGVREVALQASAAPDEKRLFLLNRKGFVRAALRAGAPLVPAFAFGQEKLYRPVVLRSPLVLWIGRKLGVMPMLMIGRWGVPMGLPMPAKLIIVVGAPLRGAAPMDDAEPSDADIDDLHARFCAALVALVEKHKARCGYANLKVTLH